MMTGYTLEEEYAVRYLSQWAMLSAIADETGAPDFPVDVRHLGIAYRVNGTGPRHDFYAWLRLGGRRDSVDSMVYVSKTVSELPKEWGDNIHYRVQVSRVWGWKTVREGFGLLDAVDVTKQTTPEERVLKAAWMRRVQVLWSGRWYTLAASVCLELGKLRPLDLHATYRATYPEKFGAHP